jgi:hypothetical protein
MEYKKEKIEVTNKILNLACDIFAEYEGSMEFSMKAALEAVFEHIANNKEKPNSSEEKQPNNDGWITHDGTADIPVDRNLVVDVKSRNGIIGTGMARIFLWKDSGREECILTYRKSKTIMKYIKDFYGEEMLGQVEQKSEVSKTEIAEKKVYKLSEMYKGWYRIGMRLETTGFYNSKESVKFGNGNLFIAITRADATEFYEGEGLD